MLTSLLGILSDNYWHAVLHALNFLGMQTIFSIDMLQMHNIPAAFLTISLMTATGAESLPCMR